MALIILGKSKCGFCGAVIEEGQALSGFPPFVSNELDPLSVFNDAAFHTECLNNHPFAGKARKRCEELLQRHAPANRICVVCNNLITLPDDYFLTGHLTDDAATPLYHYNYTQAHISCLPNWTELQQAHKLLSDLAMSGSWRGDGLKAVLTKLQHALQSAENGSMD